jgi:hypothetical protein
VSRKYYFQVNKIKSIALNLCIVMWNKHIKNFLLGWKAWVTPVIPASEEADRDQEDCGSGSAQAKKLARPPSQSISWA